MWPPMGTSKNRDPYILLPNNAHGKGFQGGPQVLESTAHVCNSFPGYPSGQVFGSMQDMHGLMLEDVVQDEAFYLGCPYPSQYFPKL